MCSSVKNESTKYAATCPFELDVYKNLLNCFAKHNQIATAAIQRIFTPTPVHSLTNKRSLILVMKWSDSAT